MRWKWISLLVVLRGCETPRGFSAEGCFPTETSCRRCWIFLSPFSGWFHWIVDGNLSHFCGWSGTFTPFASGRSWLTLTVIYYSQTKAEMNYHSFELEMLAMVRAIERFHIYLYGIEFISDRLQRNLVCAVNIANLNLRIARWTLSLQNCL